MKASGNSFMKKEEVQFRSGDLVLRGELYLPHRTPAPGILVCHAMHAQGFRWLPLYRLFAEMAAKKGFSCLLFDFCGMSEGQFDYGWGEQRDAREAFEFLVSRKEVDPTSAFLVGRSLGGTIAIYSLVHDPRVKGCALWATPPDHHQNIKSFVVKRHGRVGYLVFLLLSSIDRFHDVTRLMRLDVFGLKLRLKDLRRKMMSLRPSQLLASKNHPPILLLIGDEDEYVTMSETMKFERSLTERKRLKVLSGTGHTFKGEEEKAVSATLDWFEGLLNPIGNER
jgi:alpha/beta superfamily hydrolase